MKSRNQKNLLSVALTALMLTSPLAFSQDSLLDDADMVLNSEQIDIDGHFQERPRETAADRIAKMRKKLEQQNEQMVQKKIEDIRVQEEMKLTKRLQTAFTNGLNQMDGGAVASTDQVNTVQSATIVQASTQTVEAVADTSIKNPNKIIPLVGIANFKGDNVDFESKMNVGLSVENQISNRFSIGLGFTYSNMEITDVANTYVTNYGYGYNYNPYYNNGYYNVFGQGRQMKFSKLNFELNSKFFITGQDSKIRPFIGAGVGYNRASLKYEDNGQGYAYNNVNFGNEGYTTNYVSATAIIGSEVAFTDNVGMLLDVRYSKSLSSGFGTKADQGYQNPDQVRLENVGKAIEDANLLSINLGFVVRF